jgi:4-amino-4-deoxy-L-arabinose transferase-like glycosyltransferase
MHFGLGVLVLLGVAAPWFIAVSLANPEFPRFFFIHEHFERFLTTAHGRAEPVWYFVPVLAVGPLPWTTVAVHGAIAAWRTTAGDDFDARRFLLLWAAVVFLFFSASGSKLPSYVLPLFPALALLAGDWLATASPRALRWHIAVAGLAALVAVVLVLHRTGVDIAGDTPEAMLARYGRWLAVAWGVFAAGALLALWQNGSGRRLAALATIGAAATFTAATTLQGHEALGRSNSADYIAQRIRPELPPGVPFYSVGMYEQTLPFYIERTVTLVEYLDEFSFGLQQEPHLSIATVEEFTRRWKGEPQAFAIFTRDGWKLIQNWHLPMEIVAQDARRVIVKKPRISPP